MSRLDSKVLHAIRSSFIVLLTEAGSTHINNRTKSTAFHESTLFQFGEQLLKNGVRPVQRVQHIDGAKFLGFMIGNLTKVLDEGRSIKQLYVSNVPFLSMTEGIKCDYGRRRQQLGRVVRIHVPGSNLKQLGGRAQVFNVETPRSQG